MISFTIPGEPIGKARPRVTRYGAYTPENTKNYEVLVKEMFAISYPNHQPFADALEIKVTAWFSIPKSTSKKKSKLMADGIIRPTKKPDYDNIGKAVSDALNGIAYKDDSQIVAADIKKYYTSEQPRVEVIIREVQL